MQQNDLISRKALSDAVEELRAEYLEEDTKSSDFAAEVIELIHDNYILTAPAVEAEPVVHGRWEKTYVMGGIERKYSRFMVKCSVCGWGNVCQYNFCPNCGAKMDGKSNVPRADAEIDFDYEAED